jgi:hypothetical protein
MTFGAQSISQNISSFQGVYIYEESDRDDQLPRLFLRHSLFDSVIIVAVDFICLSCC